ELCMVSSLHDGMNLVAKEFVSSRDDERGVLILSQFTGAARELPEAIIVNPYDTDQCAAALHMALSMPPAGQRARIRLMRGLIQEFNVYRWAGRMLIDAVGMRRRDAAGRISRHAVPAQGLHWARGELATAVAQHHGLALEDKGLSLALHYRRAPRLGGYAHSLMRSLAARIGSQYCVQTGKRIVEMKPAGKDKGVAVLEFMQEEPFRGRTPVFVGDDITDEYG